MYGDPRPLLLVTGVVVIGLGLWVMYVLAKAGEAWPVAHRDSKKTSDAPLDKPER